MTDNNTASGGANTASDGAADSASGAGGATANGASTPAPTFDGATFRNVLGHFPTGVTVITAMGSAGPVGLAVGSFSSVSLEPPMVMFCPGNQSSSWPGIQAAGVFCANVLADDQKNISAIFASKSQDKFADISWTTKVTGSPVLNAAQAWIDCEIVEAIEAGDHWIVLGRVLALEANTDKTPLLFYRGGYGSYRELGAD